jgi:hypothetical protein
MAIEGAEINGFAGAAAGAEHQPWLRLPKAYGLAVLEDDAGDEAYADDVCELIGRAGRNSPFCKRPD